MPRSQCTTDWQGRRVGPPDLVAMLEEHLDLGRPTVERANDIRAILKELALLAVPKTNRLGLIDRMKTINSSRSALCWEDLEEEVHLLLTGIIRRYVHTTPRPGLPAKLRPKLTPATKLPPPRAKR